MRMMKVKDMLTKQGFPTHGERGLFGISLLALESVYSVVLFFTYCIATVLRRRAYVVLPSFD